MRTHRAFWTLARIGFFGVFAALAQMAAADSHTLTFKPSRDGFAFSNSFKGYPPPFDGLDVPGVSDSYGLCGGMCFAAADFFHARQSLPKDSAPPASGSRLHDYLVERQADSFGDAGEQIIKFLAWMVNDDEGEDGVWNDTYNEMNLVVEQLKADKLVVLGLVVADGADPAMVWDNHQVLAFGFSRPSGDELVIYIYDPNFPKRNDISLQFRRVKVDDDDEGNPIFGYRASEDSQGRNIRKIRGAFRMDYEPMEPAP